MGPSKENRQLICSKDPNSLMAFKEGFFKTV